MTEEKVSYRKYVDPTDLGDKGFIIIPFEEKEKSPFEAEVEVKTQTRVIFGKRPA